MASTGAPSGCVTGGGSSKAPAAYTTDIHHLSAVCHCVTQACSAARKCGLSEDSVPSLPLLGLFVGVLSTLPPILEHSPERYVLALKSMQKKRKYTDTPSCSLRAEAHLTLEDCSGKLRGLALVLK